MVTLQAYIFIFLHRLYLLWHKQEVLTFFNRHSPSWYTLVRSYHFYWWRFAWYGLVVELSAQRKPDACRRLLGRISSDRRLIVEYSLQTVSNAGIMATARWLINTRHWIQMLADKITYSASLAARIVTVTGSFRVAWLQTVFRIRMTIPSTAGALEHHATAWQL